MYTKEEISTRSKSNIKDHGEVFTPFSIVDKMNDLIPEEAWADKEFCFLEPTCGNGQILVKIFERRINAGISIETALNTMIGMDISKQNINESAIRLFERAASQMRVEGIEQGSNEWFSRAITITAIVSNNIFQVKDSLDFMKSKLSEKRFFSVDPTGNNQVQTKSKQKELLDRIKKEFKKGKMSVTLSSFFVKKDAVA